jgi:hypothetical protein
MKGAMARVLVAGFSLAGPAVGADDFLDKLSVHGFLSQAYGQAADSSATVIGITKDGTTDYRTAAIQFSYALTEKDRFLLQPPSWPTSPSTGPSTSTAFPPTPR